MSLLELTEDNFENTIKKYELTLMYYYNPNDARCEMYTKTFEQVAKDFPDIAFGKINVSVEKLLTESFRVDMVPITLFMRQELVINVQPGPLPEDKLREIVKQATDLDMNEVRRVMVEKEDEIKELLAKAEQLAKEKQEQAAKPSTNSKWGKLDDK